MMYEKPENKVYSWLRDNGSWGRSYQHCNICMIFWNVILFPHVKPEPVRILSVCCIQCNHISYLSYSTVKTFENVHPVRKCSEKFELMFVKFWNFYSWEYFENFLKKLFLWPCLECFVRCSKFCSASKFTILNWTHSVTVV